MLRHIPCHPRKIDTNALLHRPSGRIATCLDNGLGVAHTALLSFHGRSRSALLALDRLGV